MAHIKSFGDLGGSGSDDEGPGDFNDYYAGGEKSGQLIRGAPDEVRDKALSRSKGKKRAEDEVGDLFEKARQHGAEAGTADDLAGPSGGAAGFRGAGRTLDGAGAAQAGGSGGGATTHVVTFYRNRTFVVDDGAGRSLDDPANAAFLAAIERGECPDELEPATRGALVNVNLVRVDDDYVAPKYVAFGGSGHTLAGSGGASGSGSGAAAAAPAAPAGEWAGVDDGAPTTSLQLRLADGSRMVARFNVTHTVSDVRRFIRASRPDLGAAPYQLLAGFPSAPVADEGATLEAAGLLNAVLIQKL